MASCKPAIVAAFALWCPVAMAQLSGVTVSGVTVTTSAGEAPLDWGGLSGAFDLEYPLDVDGGSTWAGTGSASGDADCDLTEGGSPLPLLDTDVGDFIAGTGSVYFGIAADGPQLLSEGPASCTVLDKHPDNCIGAGNPWPCCSGAGAGCGDISAGAWINRDAAQLDEHDHVVQAGTTGNMTIMCRSATGDGDGTNLARCYINGTLNATSAPTSCGAGWHHVAASYSYSSGECTLWLDGVDVTSDQGTQTRVAPAGKVELGGRQPDDGNIDNAWIRLGGQVTAAEACRHCACDDIGADGGLCWCDGTSYRSCSTDADCGGRTGACNATDGLCNGRQDSHCGNCTLPACDAAAPSG